MQTKIDNLVRDIHTNLARAPLSDPQVADVFMFLGCNGQAVAAELRDVLASWSEDVLLSAEIRAYACRHLDALPAF
jgi:hypothetical protein